MCSRLKQEWRALLLAMGLLTRIPIPTITEFDARIVGLSLHWYPVAGLLIALPLVAVALLSPLSPLLAAALVLCTWVSVTGGIHLDGVADCADAWVGGMGDRDRTLAIMQDPACGPAGVVMLVLVLIVKLAALTVIFSVPVVTGWWLVPAFARTFVVLAFLSTPYVRPGGMGAGLGEQGSPVATSLIIGITLLVSALTSPVLIWGLWLLTAGGLFLLWQRQMARRLGGFTGDGAGALVELQEALLLVVAALMTAGMSA